MKDIPAGPRPAIEAALAEGRAADALALAMAHVAGPNGAVMQALAGLACLQRGDVPAAATHIAAAARHGGALRPVQALLGRAARLAAREADWPAVAPAFLAVTVGDEALAAIALAAALAGDAASALRAASAIAAPARVQPVLDKACGVLAMRAGWAAAHALLPLLAAPSAECRGRCARAALQAGRIAEAVALVTPPGEGADHAAAREAVCRRAAVDGHAALAAGLLAEMPAPSPEAVRAVATALAESGQPDAVQALIDRHAPHPGPAAALLRAIHRRGLGELAAARQGLEAALLAWPEDPDLLWFAMRLSTEADDPAAAARHAARRIPAEAEPARLLDLARCAAEGGEAEAATAALARGRAGLAEALFAGRNPVRLVLPALRLFDLPTARRAMQGLLPQEQGLARMLRDWETDIAAEPALAGFVERAARAFAGEAPAAADLAIIARMTLFPSTITDRVTGALQPEVEVLAARRVLALALARAEAAGLGCVVIPALSNRVPDAARRLAPVFLGYHTTAEPGAGLHVKLSPLSGHVLIDRAGYSGWAEPAGLELAALPLETVPQDRADAWLAAERARVAAGNISKYGQAARGTALPGEAVLVALQKPDDSVLRHAWLDMFSFARAVVRAFAGSGVTVLVKRHPRCRDPRTTALLREIGQAPHVTLTEASVHDLLPAVRAVYVVNSGVGAEALLYGTPVHVAGRVDYRHACHEIHAAEDIRAAPAAFRPKLDPATQARYLYWYCNINAVPLAVPGALESAVDDRIVQTALRRRG